MRIGTVVKEQFREKYTEILQQKLKRYRIHFTTGQRHMFYSCVSLAVIGSVFLLTYLTSPVRIIRINHLDCQGTQCIYTFKVSKALSKHTYIYSVVGGAAQTHMKYDTPTVEAIDMIKRSFAPEEIPHTSSIPKITECTPYISEGKWIYPCGPGLSTFPQDTYRIFSLQSKEEVPIAADSEREQINSWMNPSSFSAGTHKIGEIPGLETGEYILAVQKQIKHPLPNREVVIIGNIGSLGTSFHSTAPYMVAAAASLAIINSFACMMGV